MWEESRRKTHIPRVRIELDPKHLWNKLVHGRLGKVFLHRGPNEKSKLFYNDITLERVPGCLTSKWSVPDWWWLICLYYYWIIYLWTDWTVTWIWGWQDNAVMGQKESAHILYTSLQGLREAISYNLRDFLTNYSSYGNAIGDGWCTQWPSEGIVGATNEILHISFNFVISTLHMSKKWEEGWWDWAPVKTGGGGINYSSTLSFKKGLKPWNAKFAKFVKLFQ